MCCTTLNRVREHRTTCLKCLVMFGEKSIVEEEGGRDGRGR